MRWTLNRYIVGWSVLECRILTVILLDGLSCVCESTINKYVIRSLNVLYIILQAMLLEEVLEADESAG